MNSTNTMNLESFIDQLDDNYKLSPYLMLRGSASYRVAKLAGMYAAKLAKLYMIAEDETGIDAFNRAMGTTRGEIDSDSIMEEAGAELSDMHDQLKSLTLYCNKLNFDMQELVDPTGRRRQQRGFMQRGVYFNDVEQRASWASSVKLVSESGEAKDSTYADYVASLDDPEWAITELEFNELNTDDMSLYDDHAEVIVDMILDFGNDEIDFSDLPIRTQISLIENMRGKIERMQASAIKSVKFSRLAKMDKIAEGTKLKGIIAGLNQLFCDMLDSSRYANYAEFMYNYIPNAGDSVAHPVSRRIVAKRELNIDTAPLGRVDDETAERINETA